MCVTLLAVLLLETHIQICIRQISICVFVSVVYMCMHTSFWAMLNREGIPWWGAKTPQKFLGL